MCTVLLRYRPGAGWPLLLAAVRDEFTGRAWDPPATHWGDSLVGGRDRLAGGTWLAIDPRAVDPRAPAVAAVLNGVRRPVTGARPSRGQLPLRALRGVPLPAEAALRDYDGFHLLYATPAGATLSTWDGVSLRRQALDPGDHVIVNAGLDVADDPVTVHMGPLLRRVASPEPRRGAGTVEAWGDWVPLFAGDGRDPSAPGALLVDHTVAGNRYGSTSAALVGLRATGVRYDFCGAPVTPDRWFPVLQTE